MFKKIAFILLIVCFLGIGSVKIFSHSLAQESLLKIHFLDVGQGDAIYIRTPEGQDILIDGGPDNQVVQELSQVMPFWDHEIDIMILTHPHADHVTGLTEVLRRYEVKQIYHTGVTYSTQTYLNWLHEIEQQQVPLQIVQSEFALDLETDLILDFLYPNQSFLNQKVDNLNNTSIVNRLVYKNTRFLFMGDAEQEVDEELVETQSFYFAQDDNASLQADLIKIAHHGSKDSSTQEFLEKVNPEFAVITCGKDNDFYFPHFRVLHRLEKLGVKIFRTDLHGRITAISDGAQIKVEKEF